MYLYNARQQQQPVETVVWFSWNFRSIKITPIQKQSKKTKLRLSNQFHDFKWPMNVSILSRLGFSLSLSFDFLLLSTFSIIFHVFMALPFFIAVSFGFSMVYRHRRRRCRGWYLFLLHLKSQSHNNISLTHPKPCHILCINLNDQLKTISRHRNSDERERECDDEVFSIFSLRSHFMFRRDSFFVSPLSRCI